MTRILLFLTVFSVYFQTQIEAEIISVGEDISILMIGNSYSAGTRNSLQGFIDATNTKYSSNITLTAYTPGGRKIYDHSILSTPVGYLNSGNFDHIILQDQSVMLAYAYEQNLTAMDAGANFLRAHEAADPKGQLSTQVYHGWTSIFDRIKTANTTHNVSSNVHIFQTWGRLPGQGAVGSYEEHTRRNLIVADDLQEEAQNAYGLDAHVNYVGQSWKQGRENHGLGLHGGDGSHATAEGYFLAAATIYQDILNIEASDANELVSQLGYNSVGTNGNLLMNIAEANSIPEPNFISLPFISATMLFLRRKR